MSANAISDVRPATIPNEVVEPDKLRPSASHGFHDFSVTQPWLTRTSWPVPPDHLVLRLVEGIKRRWRRERRRRAVGRAYDMAIEIARYVPPGSEVLDVGCGNGLIGHHLSALLGKAVAGIDVVGRARAPIAYQQYDGARFPVADKSFDAVLFCYVLHHVQDVGLVLRELGECCATTDEQSYTDMPHRGSTVVLVHDLQWRPKIKPCSFHLDHEWRAQFQFFGFEIVTARSLSRWRNFTHPVARRVYVLRRMRQQPDAGHGYRSHVARSLHKVN